MTKLKMRITFKTKSWHRLDYRLDDKGLTPGRTTDFSLHHCVQTGSGDHPASYPISTRDSFPRCKVANA